MFIACYFVLHAEAMQTSPFLTDNKYKWSVRYISNNLFNEIITKKMSTINVTNKYIYILFLIDFTILLNKIELDHHDVIFSF